MYYLGRVNNMASDPADAVWIQLAPFGTWTPYGQDLSISREKANRMVNHFKQNIRGHEIELDYDHKMDRAKGNKASGWIRDMEVRDDGLYGLVAWTPLAKQEIAAGEWKYFSLEWSDQWEHPTTQVSYNDVVFGGGLTNRPQHKGRLPINASELVLESNMGDEPTDTPVDTPQAQKQDQANPDNELDPGVAQPRQPTHKEPNTVPDNPSPEHPADDDPGADAGFMEKLKAWIGKNVPDAVDDTDKTQEGDVVKLDALRNKLGLPDDADEDAINAAIDGMKAEIEPLRKVAAEVDSRNKFAAEYPAEHSRMVALEQAERTRKAHDFAEQFTDLGDGRALSTVAREKVENAYMAAENGTISQADLADVLATVTDKEHIVEYGEQGSNQAAELREPSVDAFADKVKEYQASDNLDYRSAVHMAAEKHPELAEAYHKHFSTVNGGDE
jgi:phage I-like protein